MVEIDVRNLTARGCFSGETAFEFEAEDSLIEIPYVKFAAPVKANLRYEIYEDDSVGVRGTVSFTLQGLCSRCLNETRQAVTGEVDALFVPNGDGEDDYAYRGGKVRLEEALRDAVLFAIPARLVCENACKLPEWE